MYQFYMCHEVILAVKVHLRFSALWHHVVWYFDTTSTG